MHLFYSIVKVRIHRRPLKLIGPASGWLYDCGRSPGARREVKF
jgi:hypothetical protein